MTAVLALLSAATALSCRCCPNAAWRWRQRRAYSCRTMARGSRSPSCPTSPDQLAAHVLVMPDPKGGCWCSIRERGVCVNGPGVPVVAPLTSGHVRGIYVCRARVSRDSYSGRGAFAQYAILGG